MSHLTEREIIGYLNEKGSMSLIDLYEAHHGTCVLEDTVKDEVHDIDDLRLKILNLEKSGNVERDKSRTEKIQKWKVKI